MALAGHCEPGPPQKNRLGNYAEPVRYLDFFADGCRRLTNYFSVFWSCSLATPNV